MTAPVRPWWERVVDGAVEVVKLAASHAEPAPVEPPPAPELAPVAGEASLVDEQPCDLAPAGYRCSRRRGHEPHCALERAP